MLKMSWNRLCHYQYIVYDIYYIMFQAYPEFIISAISAPSGTFLNTKPRVSAMRFLYLLNSLVVRRLCDNKPFIPEKVSLRF